MDLPGDRGNHGKAVAVDVTINTQGGTVNIYPSETSIGELEAEGEGVLETSVQEASAYDAGFKGGWKACLQEVQTQFIGGRLIDFFNEQGSVHDQGQAEDIEIASVRHQDIYGSQDAHANEPEGTGEDFGEHDDQGDLIEGIVGRQVTLTFKDQESAAEFANGARIPVVVDDPAIRPVVDSGEPDKETAPVVDEEGTWTISNAELNSRINEAYRRGKADGELVPKETTRRTVQIMVTELITQVWPEGIPAGLSKQEVFEEFSLALLKRVGFEVFE